MQRKYFISKYVMKRKMISLQKEAGSKLVEKARTGNDFERISTFFSHHHINLAPSSLKKLWNYLSEVEKPSRQTLDRLSLFAGFQDWESLKATFMDEEKKEDNQL